MIKLTFMGAGSTIFAKNVLGDILLTDALRHTEIALYDIDKDRLEESYQLITTLNRSINNNRAVIKSYLGVENRREALRGANFVINAVQIGGYEPSTVIDFEIPKKYGLRQTIADTLGVGGVFRALRTIPILREFAEDIEAVCPDAWFLNYSNPMAMLTGYMLRHTNVKTVGLCHSVQCCTRCLFEVLGLPKFEGRKEIIAGINHMAWLLDIRDKDGNDLYPLIRETAAPINGHHSDAVRLDYLNKFGYYVTESSEHNAEYNPFYIKNKYPQLIEKYGIPLDEYPRRCVEQIEGWKKQKEELFAQQQLTHTRSDEYAARILEAMVTNTPYKMNGNVLNNGIIPNLPAEACVEVPCMVDGTGIHPTYVGSLPQHLAAMNQSNISPQLLAIQAAVSKRKEDVYYAVMMDPHTGAELSLEDIIAMCDEMIEAHNATPYKVLW